MSSVLLWAGIALTVLGWIDFARQAARRMAVKDELDKFPGRRHAMFLRRNYSRVAILAGILLILVAVAAG